MASEELKAKFWERVDIVPGFGPNRDCWRWTGSSHKDTNRPQLIDGWSVYQLAYEIQCGPLPAARRKKKVFHTCNNPECVRGSHLFLATQKKGIRTLQGAGYLPTRKEAVDTPMRRFITLSPAQGQKLRGLRDDKGVTMGLLQETVKIDKGLYSKFEKGARGISYDKFRAILIKIETDEKILGIQKDQIATRRDIASAEKDLN